MGKTAKRYLDVDPWVIRESGFHPERAVASESIFALANEFMGVRGAFEEGYSGEGMPGFYFNGIYEKGVHRYSTKFKGFAEQWTFMVNAVDWLYTRIVVDGEQLDLARCRHDDFVRQVDMRRGILERSFVWTTRAGSQIRVAFERFPSMSCLCMGFQRISLEAINADISAELRIGLDFSTEYHLRQSRPWRIGRRSLDADGWVAALGRTQSSGHRLFSAFRLSGDFSGTGDVFSEENLVGKVIRLPLKMGQVSRIDKTVVHHSEKDIALDDGTVCDEGYGRLARYGSLSYDEAVVAQERYWKEAWARHDVVIEGDDENQQGFRFCIFHLYQTYHGADPRYNVGAKGLTGEHYWGVTWWDTETYCLPFYIFNNPMAARNLLAYRYRTLPGARKRARDFHLPGARYPMCTIDGEEVCDVWQHGDLEIHVSAAVAYGVWKYHHLTRDDEFLYGQGVEILVEVARFYAARGSWGQLTGEFGFWGVMGPDEMHLMVNNNAYTNFMAKKCFEWALGVLAVMAETRASCYRDLCDLLSLRDEELCDWRLKADRMALMLDKGSGIYEQHEGFFNLPHIDYSHIPDDQFPVQKKWPYVDLFRYDLIKQPDVLLFMFLFGTEFSGDDLRRNFEYYEPRCSHESSLSPAIHSILAARLGDAGKSFEYARYASRLDLDDYNNNTWEGLHVTSMAGTWMNLVYGFGGMRSDGDLLSFDPFCPPGWEAFSFRLCIGEKGVLSVRVGREESSFMMGKGTHASIVVYGNELVVGDKEVRVKPPSRGIEAVIFDLDGVIVSTDKCHYLAWRRLADEEGIPFSAEDNERCRGVSRMGSLEIVLEKSTRAYSSEEKQEMAERKNAYYVDMLKEISPDDILPGAMEFINVLKKNGIKVAVGSSSRNSPRILEQIGLGKMFDATVDGNDISRSKPDPEVFLTAAERLGLPAQKCLVVEDADAGVDAAVAAGMKCLAIGSAVSNNKADFSATSLQAIPSGVLDFIGIPGTVLKKV
ncbi:MAG: beta-phosphoglucomutase [Victivallales bacterium]|nr:beta-phosphoglucomutase [Victivallales bacterium]